MVFRILISLELSLDNFKCFIKFFTNFETSTTHLEWSRATSGWESLAKGQKCLPTGIILQAFISHGLKSQKIIPGVVDRNRKIFFVPHNKKKVRKKIGAAAKLRSWNNKFLYLMIHRAPNGDHLLCRVYLLLLLFASFAQRSSRAVDVARESLVSPKLMCPGERRWTEWVRFSHGAAVGDSRIYGEAIVKQTMQWDTQGILIAPSCDKSCYKMICGSAAGAKNSAMFLGSWFLFELLVQGSFGGSIIAGLQEVPPPVKFGVNYDAFDNIGGVLITNWIYVS